MVIGRGNGDGAVAEMGRLLLSVQIIQVANLILSLCVWGSVIIRSLSAGRF